MRVRRRRRTTYWMAALAIVVSIGAARRAPTDAAPQVLPLWRYTTELSLDLPSAPRDSGVGIRLTDAVQVVANSRGQMFVVQVPGTVTLLAPDGSIVARTELTSNNWGTGITAGSVGDSLWVWEASRKQVTIFAPTSSMARRTFKVGDSDGGTIGGIRLPSMILRVRAVYGDGSVLAEGTSKDDDLRTTAFDGRGMPLVRVAKNKVRDIVEWLPLASTRPDLLLNTSNAPTTSRGRAGAIVHIGYAPSVNGAYVSTVRAAFRGSDSTRLRTTTMSADGDTLFSHGTYPFSLIPAPPSSPPRLQPVRPFIPPVRDAFPAANGSVMLSMEAETREGDQEYLIFDATGTPRARVRLPFLIAVSQFEGNHIWGYWADKSPDVVLRLRVHPAGG
jgi:hypothetical protein